MTTSQTAAGDGTELGQMTFEEVADWAESLPDDDRVYADPIRGHIRLGNVVFADTGSVLHLWSYSGHRLTPATARALGEALTAWGTQKDQG
jgi:hypothetical protein